MPMHAEVDLYPPVAPQDVDNRGCNNVRLRQVRVLWRARLRSTISPKSGTPENPDLSQAHIVAPPVVDILRGNWRVQVDFGMHRHIPASDLNEVPSGPH